MTDRSITLGSGPDNSNAVTLVENGHGTQAPLILDLDGGGVEIVGMGEIWTQKQLFKPKTKPHLAFLQLIMVNE